MSHPGSASGSSQQRKTLRLAVDQQTSDQGRMTCETCSPQQPWLHLQQTILAAGSNPGRQGTGSRRSESASLTVAARASYPSAHAHLLIWSQQSCFLFDPLTQEYLPVALLQPTKIPTCCLFLLRRPQLVCMMGPAEFLEPQMTVQT